MSRAKWKGPFFDLNLFKKISTIQSKTPQNWWNKKLRTRNSVIPKMLVGRAVYVYNGHFFKKLNISTEQVGFKFGDFCFTRTIGKKKPKKLKKKK